MRCRGCKWSAPRCQPQEQLPDGLHKQMPRDTPPQRSEFSYSCHMELHRRCAAAERVRLRSEWRAASLLAVASSCSPSSSSTSWSLSPQWLWHGHCAQLLLNCRNFILCKLTAILAGVTQRKCRWIVARRQTGNGLRTRLPQGCPPSGYEPWWPLSFMLSAVIAR